MSLEMHTLKYISLMAISAIGTVWIHLLLMTCRSVSGRHLVLRGIRVRRWHRCRKLHDAVLVHFFNPRHHIQVDNDTFHFVCENVSTMVRKTSNPKVGG